MRLRSTGLGKTELEANIVEVKRVNDTVLFIANTNKPVKWKARMVFQQEDLRKLFFNVMKPRNFWYVVRALMNSKRRYARTETF